MAGTVLLFTEICKGTEVKLLSKSLYRNLLKFSTQINYMPIIDYICSALPPTNTSLPLQHFSVHKNRIWIFEIIQPIEILL